MLDKKQKLDNKTLKYVSLLAQIGGIVALSVLSLSILGIFLESKFPSNNLFLTIGTISGVILGFFYAYIMIKKFFYNNEENKD